MLRGGTHPFDRKGSPEHADGLQERPALDWFVQTHHFLLCTT